jgi:CheY-like chemotaxis protein
VPSSTSDREGALRILYVDDSAVQLLSVRTALAELGHHVAIAEDLANARRVVAGRELVIIDWHMPEMNGDQLLKQLRATPGVDPETLFYVYTIDVEVAARFREHGFDGAFTGKGSVDTLVAQLDTAKRMLRLRRFRRTKQ